MAKNKAIAVKEQSPVSAADGCPRYYVGLDVASRKTQVCILDDKGKLFLEKELKTHPAAIADYLRKHCASGIEQVALETGGMSSWIYHGLRKSRIPVVVLDALTVHRYLSVKRNKTDINDARGIAELIRKGLDWLNVVHVKSAMCHEIRSLLVIRNQLVRQRVQSEMMVRSVLRLYGGIIAVKGNSQSAFREEAVRQMIAVQDADNIDLRPRLLPVIDLCHELERKAAAIEDELIRLAQADPVCRKFMDIPGVGAIVALSFYTAIEDPKRFKRIEDVGAYFGLTPRTYQSGETETSGGISHMGNRLTRTHLVQAANVILTHTQSWSSLKSWGVKLAKKVGYNKAKVAVARKLAIVMLSMWRDNTPFYHSQETLLAYKAARAA
jgi:transposase